MKKSFQSLLLFLILLLVASPAHALAEDSHELNYVALGDSLAQGFLNEGNLAIGDGYPVYINEGIEDETEYDVNKENFGFGGFRTVDVLSQLNEDDVQAYLQEAELITLNIGANDVLGAVDMPIEFDDPDLIPNVLAAIETVEENVGQILDEVTQLNSDAPIYVMAYYNALPYEDDQDVVEIMIDALNEAITAGADNHNVTFVPTFDAFDGKHEIYLPNPDDIHPNEEGYRVIADLFLDEIVPALPPIDIDVDPEITLIDDNPMEIEVGSVYEEPGATAEDYEGRDITEYMEITGAEEVNTDEPNDYTITYTVEDDAGNEAVKERTVTVVEAEEVPEPEITLEGEDLMDIAYGSEFNDPGATATDPEDGDISGDIVIDGEVDTSEPGQYTLTYTVENSAGETDEVTRTVNVLEPPKEEPADPPSGQGASDEDLGIEEDDYLDEKTGDLYEKDADHKDSKDNDNDQHILPVDKGSGTGKTESGDRDSVEHEKGGMLPDTAGSTPLMILIGSLLTIGGGALLFRRKLSMQ